MHGKEKKLLIYVENVKGRIFCETKAQMEGE
jgi:hypothetical protein